LSPPDNDLPETGSCCGIPYTRYSWFEAWQALAREIQDRRTELAEKLVRPPVVWPRRDAPKLLAPPKLLAAPAEHAQATPPAEPDQASEPQE
jgi:hypothetical protein